MTRVLTFRGGRNVAMKVPAHQFVATVESYRALGIPVLAESESTVCFEYGPIRLHVDKVTNLSQAEIWLEFITPDVLSAAAPIERAGFARCDEIEELSGDNAAFWVSSPASIIHLVSEKE
jgi:hypothetical protein